jgi:hypothetical protein
MSRNGSGTYVLPAGNPVVTGTTISSSWANTTLDDIKVALTQSIAVDGQTPITANIPMNNHKITGLLAGTALTDAATLSNVIAGAGTYIATVSGSANGIILSANPAITAYAVGQRFSFIAAAANTTAVTVNISGLGAKDLTKTGAIALVANEILAGAVVTIEYDGTQFQLLNPAAAATVSSFSAGTTGFTPSTATTGAVTLSGTLAVGNGGTGLTSLPVNELVVGAAGSTPTGIAPSTSGNVLTSNGTTWASSPAAGAIGTGQTWQNVTGSRSSGTTYTNSTGKPIFVYQQNGNLGFTGTAWINAISWNYNTATGIGTSVSSVALVVPDGNTYGFTFDGAQHIWLELR